jgi:hypothetical protein
MLEGSKHVASSWYKRGEISMVLGVELSGPILSARRRTIVLRNIIIDFIELIESVQHSPERMGPLG